MQNEDYILEVYQTNQVDGRTEFCPRKGMYKILSVYQGTCLNKPATMATVYWKLQRHDSYSPHIFTIQLESFKTKLQPLNTENIIGREIEILDARWFPRLVFALNWNLLPLETIDLNYLNKLLNESKRTFDIAQVDFDTISNLEDGEEAEYGDL